MSENVKHAWQINALLAVVLVLLFSTYARNHALPSAQAAGGGWETSGVMVLANKGTAERLVLIDTTKQNIMIYKERNAGGFGLTGARSYKYDVEIEDSEKAKIPGNGFTYMQAMAAYEAAKK